MNNVVPDEAVTFETLDGVLVVRFARPEARSPLSRSVVDRTNAILDEAENACPIVFTGTGDVFASGADLREIDGLAAAAAVDFARMGQRLMGRVAGHTARTIAAVNGYCFGGALDLALACDARIASPEAVFCHPGVGLGIITGWGGTQRLPRLVGAGRAAEMLFTADRVTAGEALAIGLVDEIVPDVVGRAIDLARG